MNKTLLVAVLFLIIGFGAGAFIYKNKQNPAVSQTPSTIVDSNLVAASSQNELFNLFDLFKNYPGHISVFKVDEGLGLMIVWHPAEVKNASDQGNDAPATYSVYDYRNNKIYKNLGMYGLGGGQYPEGIINSSSILVTKGGDGIPYKLVAQDFSGQTIKEFSIKLVENSNVEVSTARDGYLTFWVKDSGSSNGSYKLNTQTLELTKN